MVGNSVDNKIYSNLPKISSPQIEKSPLNMPIIIIGVIAIILVLTGIFLYTQRNSEDKISQQRQRTEGTLKELSVDENCDIFPNKLDSCTEYKCQFTHPLTGDLLTKEILGLTNDGKCNYIEEMPNSGKMECEYTESIRKAIVQYYEDLSNAESAGLNASIKFGTTGTEVETTYTLDGKEVENPLQEVLNNGQCVISGYD